MFRYMPSLSIMYFPFRHRLLLLAYMSVWERKSFYPGSIQFSYNLGSGAAELRCGHTRVDDGRWHRIRATR